MDRHSAETLLQTAVGDPSAHFRPGQWEAIDALVNRRRKLMVVQRTGWGKEYSTAIFYHTEAQRVAAEESKAALIASDRYAKLVVTPILPAMRFYVAEDNHQDYYKRNPLRYKFYRYSSGRNRYLEKIWGTELHVDYGSFSDAAHSPKQDLEKEGYGQYLDLVGQDGERQANNR